MYKPEDWVEEPMRERKYELKLTPTATGGLLLIKSMTKSFAKSEWV